MKLSELNRPPNLRLFPRKYALGNQGGTGIKPPVPPQQDEPTGRATTANTEPKNPRHARFLGGGAKSGI